MTTGNREADDAPPGTPRRSRRALVVAVLLGVLVGVGGFFVVVRDPPPPPPPSPSPSSSSSSSPGIATPVAPPPPALPAEPPTPTPKPPPRRPTHRSTAEANDEPHPAARSGGLAPVVVERATGGDAPVRRALEAAFRRHLQSAGLSAARDSGYALTLRVDDQEVVGDEVTVRCALSVALLPKKNILASLRARADVSGEGTPVDELLADAADACARTLALDVKGWVQRHPP